MLMHAGMPDMKAPIAYALSYPKRIPEVLPRLNLAEVGKLIFEEPSTERFPCLDLARRALEIGGTATAALNAADEVAVEAFLNAEIPLTAIPAVIGKVLEKHDVRTVSKPEDALDADICARELTKSIIKEKNYI